MRDPFKIDSPTCISFSGGRTSAYMLWRVLQSNGGLPAEAKVCFANTGKEDPATLEFVRDCENNWGVSINWLEYGRGKVDYETSSKNGEPYAELIAKRRFLPNPIARFCTSDLKIKPIETFMHSLGMEDFETMVGIRFDEQRRIVKLRASKLTPLVTAGVDQSVVQNFWKNNSFDLGLSFRNGVTAAGNCDLCFLKGGAQIQSLIHEKPERAMWWAKMEFKIGGTFRSDRPSYAAMLKFSQEQRDMFDVDEETISCFCGD